MFKDMHIGVLLLLLINLIIILYISNKGLFKR